MVVAISLMPDRPYRRVEEATAALQPGDVLDNPRAMEQFLSRVERRAFRMADIATGDPEEALDLVQEAMLKLVQRYGSRSSEEWGPLFHRILQSKIRDWYRRSRVRVRWRVWLGQGHPDEEMPDPIQTMRDPAGRSPEQQAGTQEAISALDLALQALPLRQQQAFLLRIWEGLNVAQTANAMGCSEGSVKTHYSRAVHTLRQRLDEHWP